MAHIHKLSTQDFGGRDAPTFLGSKGDIILDPVTLTFYYHDGVTRGGVPIFGSGSGAVFQQLGLSGNTLTISGGNSVDLSNVGFSGDYNDLINAPAIPVVTPDQTLSLVGSSLSISNGNTVELGSLLFSGDYNDLINKPTIPADQTLTLSGNTITISGSWSAVDLTPILGSGSGGSTVDELTDLVDVVLPAGAAQGDVLTINASGNFEFLPLSASSETLTTISLVGNDLQYVDELGTTTTIDLSVFLDNVNLPRLVSGSFDPNTSIITLTRDDTTSFGVDVSALSASADTYTNSAAMDANSLVTFTRNDGNTYTLDLAPLKETVTALTFDSANNTLTYKDETGANTDIILPAGGNLPNGTFAGQQLYWNGSTWIPQVPGTMAIWPAASDATADADYTNRGGAANRVGRVYYRQADDTFRYYSNAGWKDLIPAGGTDTFTNTAAMDANSLVTFTRNDSNTFTLDLAPLKVDLINDLSDVNATPANGDVLTWDNTSSTWVATTPTTGTTIPDGTAFGQLLWWSGGGWNIGPSGDITQYGFQFDGYIGTFLSKGDINYYYDYANTIQTSTGSALTYDMNQQFHHLKITSGSNVTILPTQVQTSVVKKTKLEIEISNGASVDLGSGTGVTFSNNAGGGLIDQDGTWIVEVVGRQGSLHGNIWKRETFANVGSWKSLGTTTVSNNSMPVTTFGFATVADLFAEATEGMIVVRDGTEYVSSSIPSAAVSSYPATFPIYKGGSLLASMTFNAPTDTIFDINIHSADEVKVFYR